MSEELRPCPFCGTLPQANTWTLHGISETRYFCPNPECPHSVRTVTLEEWQTRPIEDELRKRIAELEAAQRWIPVSEPPKTDGTYLLRNIYEDVYSCDFIADTNTWVLSEYDSITHWMPLPQPPEVQE